MTTEYKPSTTEETNNENGRPGLPLMSPEGAALAERTAPQSGFKTSQDTKLAPSPSNELQDSMDPVFRRRLL
jgi:hypothetical protein